MMVYHHALNGNDESFFYSIYCVVNSIKKLGDSIYSIFNRACTGPKVSVVHTLSPSSLTRKTNVDLTPLNSLDTRVRAPSPVSFDALNGR